MTCKKQKNASEWRRHSAKHVLATHSVVASQAITRVVGEDARQVAQAGNCHGEGCTSDVFLQHSNRADGQRDDLVVDQESMQPPLDERPSCWLFHTIVWQMEQRQKPGKGAETMEKTYCYGVTNPVSSLFPRGSCWKIMTTLKTLG